MGDLRELLSGSGYDDVRTYLQSGNVVLSTGESASGVAAKCERLISKELGLTIPVVVRTRPQIAAVVKRDPLGTVAKEHKRYQVTFLESALPAQMKRRLEAVRVDPERIAVHGREIYAWHPEGVARSKLATLLSGKGLGVKATARNWTTVTKLLEMASP
jgi:uncharacterized protein (DUF1697 family)